MKTIYTKYILPGLLFQSIVIGGGYGTGREVVEFFLSKGPLGGYLGILISMLIWSAVMAVGFELARKEKRYDYRTFLRALLGKGWIIFEVVFIVTLILIVAVVGSASGELLNEMLGWPPLVGTIIMVLLVGFLVYRGSRMIEKVLSAWSITLYIAYLILIIGAFSMYGQEIMSRMGVYEPGTPWLKGGFQYAAYNLAALPAILFVARHFERRKEAIVAGLLSGPLAMLPALFLYTAMLSFYPEINEEAIPANFLITQFDWPVFQLFFQVILFGTFIETGTGLVHGFNERIAGVYQERGQQMPSWMRLLIGISILLLAIYVANAFGLIQLIAKGYGYITWLFWIVFLLPLLTIGLWKITGKRA